MRVAIEYVKWIMEERAKINRAKLEEIEFFENGMKVQFTQECLDEWGMTGLNNVDFITSNFPKTRFLTTDAPEMTVGDSSPISDSDLSEPCPVCQGYKEWSGFEYMPNCPACHETGRVSTAKPDDLAPSPTPSFR